jgi:hypothetical protein
MIYFVKSLLSLSYDKYIYKFTLLKNEQIKKKDQIVI